MSLFEVEKVKSHVGIKIYYPNGLNTNGTAVEGVCVTGAAIRFLVPFVGREQSRWQASMAQYLPSRCAWDFVLSRYSSLLIDDSNV